MKNKVIYNISPLSSDLVEELAKEGLVLTHTSYDTDSGLWCHKFELDYDNEFLLIKLSLAVD